MVYKRNLFKIFADNRRFVKKNTKYKINHPVRTPFKYRVRVFGFQRITRVLRDTYNASRIDDRITTYPKTRFPERLHYNLKSRLQRTRAERVRAMADPRNTRCAPALSYFCTLKLEQ